MLNPVGPLSPRVYWRRRALLAAVVLLAVVTIVVVVVGATSSGHQAAPSPTGAGVSGAAASGDASPSGSAPASGNAGSTAGGASTTGAIDISGARIGVPWTLLDRGVDADVRRAFDESVRTLERLGAVVSAVELPHSAYAIPTYYLVATAEASSNLARYDGVRYGSRAPDAASLDAMYDRTREAGLPSSAMRKLSPEAVAAA